MKTIPTVAMVVATALIAFAFAIWALFPPDGDRGTTPLSVNITPSDLQTEIFAIVDQDHIRQGDPVTYNSNPPTSGEHFASPLPWGVYGQTFPDERAVHNLEHGGIWIAYNPELDRSSVRLLRKLAAQYPSAVVMSPRPDNDSPIVVASWGRMMQLDSVDAGAINLYITTYMNDSPEQSASQDAPVIISSKEIVELVDGQPFPRFYLTDIDGLEASSDSIAGKPSLIWFTTSWCVPCQIGAKRVAKLDAELGGNAFDIVVVFVDRDEDDEDLRKWKEKFAAPDWQVAFDDQSDLLSARIGLKYLDSKYLLNRNGVLLNQDFQIANDKYLALIRRLVEET
jgi:thiol-disulfide isomerase/thioredoxin